MSYTLRPYQTDAIRRTREALLSGKRAPILVAPTASGKTVCACHIIESATKKDSRTLFIAHRKELIDQCSDKLSESGVVHGIIRSKIPSAPDSPVQLASIQTYARRIDLLAHGYDLIICDEVHHACSGSQYTKAFEANPEAIRLGLTATPYRLDGKGLGGDLFDCLIEVETVQGLTDQGFLAPSRTFVGKHVNLKGVHKKAGDWDVEELAERMDTSALTGSIVSEWFRLAQYRQTICFATNIAHSKRLVHAFSTWGTPAEHLDGKTPAKERDAINRRFRSGETRLVSNCGVWTEGADFPMCSCIIYARPTQSRSLFRQMGGRGLRICPEIGKIDCLLLDDANITETHGFLTDPDAI